MWRIYAASNKTQGRIQRGSWESEPHIFHSRNFLWPIRISEAAFSFRFYKARYILATKLNSTQSTLLKVDCCRNRQQIDNKVDCCRIRSTLLPCVRGQSNTVDFVDFQQSRPCWIDLCRQCAPRFSRATLIIWLWLGRESISCWECIDYVITPLLNFVQKL